MPLHHLRNKRNYSFSSTPPFILASVHTQDVKLKAPMERCNSLTSTVSYTGNICRICHCEEDEDMPLISPCICAGSLQYVHQSCLQQWIKSSDTKCCELCKFEFIMHTKFKPFSKWEKLEMSGIERRKLLCSVAFHAMAVTCVIWSLHILIERSTEDVRNRTLTWSFWTKLVVIAIGFTGSLVFMYVQCRMYYILFKRWRAFNRVIYVQNAPEKIPLTQSEKSITNEESVRHSPLNIRHSPLNISSEVEKPFLGLAVITSTCSSVSNLHTSSLSTSTNSTTSAGAVCICTNSSPPGAIWADDLSQPPISTFSYFNSGISNRQRGPLETETLISSSQGLTSSSRKNSKSSRSGSISELSSKMNLEPRIIHTPNNSLRSRCDEGSEASDLETVHLDST